MASVTITNPSGYFNSATLVQFGTPGYTTVVPLTDGLTGSTGDGTYEVNFVLNELTVYGAGLNAPNIHVTKLTNYVPTFPDYRIQKLNTYKVSQGVVSLLPTGTIQTVDIDGTPATGIAEDTGATGAIGWLSSIVKNLRTIAAGSGGGSSVTINDPTIPAQIAAVSAAGALKVDGSAATQPISTDGTGATGIAQDTGGAGAIGWFTSIVKNLRLIVTALAGNLTVVAQASSNIIGKVGIDQTTPGVTNGVQLSGALAAGNANIGGVEIFDSAGTNKLGIDALNRLGSITPDIVVTGQTLSFSATTNNNVLANTAGFGILGISISSSGGMGQWTLEGTINGTNWVTLSNLQVGVNLLSAWSNYGNANAVASYFHAIGAMQSVRIRCSTTGAGSLAYAYVLTNANMGMYSNIAGINLQQINTNTLQTGFFDGKNYNQPNVLNIAAAIAAYNGSTNDNIRKDSYANGPLWTTSGGGTLAAVAAAAGTTAIKASAGRLCKVLVTTVGSAQLTFYNNASAASGTIIGIVPASTPVGTLVGIDMPASAGITGDYLTNSPATTVAFW